jgi:hypothetical protein
MKTYNVDDLGALREPNFVILGRIVVKQGCGRGTLAAGIWASMILLFRLRVLSRRRVIVPGELDVVAGKQALLSASIYSRPPAFIDHVNVGDELALMKFKLVIGCFLIVKLHDGT